VLGPADVLGAEYIRLNGLSIYRDLLLTSAFLLDELTDDNTFEELRAIVVLRTFSMKAPAIYKFSASAWSRSFQAGLFSCIKISSIESSAKYLERLLDVKSSCSH
jgi:hypothetical protein